MGCGRIASLFSNDPLRKGIVTHASAYAHNNSVSLVTACDIDSKRLQEFCMRWNIKSGYTDFKEMLRKEQIDILSVCTWESTHYSIMKKALKYGIKAIFCEKPITNNLMDADEIVKLCAKRGVVLAVNHSRRWDIFEQQIRDYIITGGLGDIQSVSAYYTAGILNTGTHLLDLLRFFFGEARWVWANPEIKEISPDPTIDGYVMYKSGFGCFLHGLNVKNYLMFEVDIYGSKGRLRIQNSGANMKAWRTVESKQFSGYRQLMEIKPLFKNGLRDVLKNAVEDIVKCVKERGVPMSSGSDGLRALELICAFHSSLKARGKRIDLPLRKRDVRLLTK